MGEAENPDASIFLPYLHETALLLVANDVTKNPNRDPISYVNLEDLANLQKI